MVINQEYYPNESSKTIYFCNHNYWWDGLLPLYLNEKLFNQKARAIMEDKQMRQYPFFSKIGAFSINLENPKSSIQSLRYGLNSFNRERACLFIYPEGKITPITNEVPTFKDGLAWLALKSNDVDVVPLAIYIDHSNASKPDLHIRIGEKIKILNSLNKNELTELFQNKSHLLLNSIKTNIFNHQVHS